MRKIKNVEDALILFESNVDIIHECSKSGNYRKGNRAYDHVETIVKYLLENNAIESLKTFYESSDLYLRLSAAVYLAPLDSENCYKIIKEIKINCILLRQSRRENFPPWLYFPDSNEG